MGTVSIHLVHCNKAYNIVDIIWLINLTTWTIIIPCSRIKDRFYWEKLANQISFYFKKKSRFRIDAKLFEAWMEFSVKIIEKIQTVIEKKSQIDGSKIDRLNSLYDYLDHVNFCIMESSFAFKFLYRFTMMKVPNITWNIFGKTLLKME